MMNASEMKNVARTNTVALLSDVLEHAEAVQFADNSWAILQTIDGQEIWTEISVKTKAYKATKVSPAFDPYVAAEAWQAEKALKDEKRIAKEMEKRAVVRPVKEG